MRRTISAILALTNVAHFRIHDREVLLWRLQVEPDEVIKVSGWIPLKSGWILVGFSRKPNQGNCIEAFKIGGDNEMHLIKVEKTCWYTP